jgi:nucleotide-binding universal stress UspA family protein
MMTTQHILVPVDFSGYAEQALEYAIELARKLPACLTLVHVLHIMPTSGADEGVALLCSYLEEIEEDVQHNMEVYHQRVQGPGWNAPCWWYTGSRFRALWTRHVTNTWT